MILLIYFVTLPIPVLGAEPSALDRSMILNGRVIRPDLGTWEKQRSPPPFKHCSADEIEAKVRRFDLAQSRRSGCKVPDIRLPLSYPQSLDEERIHYDHQRQQPALAPQVLFINVHPGALDSLGLTGEPLESLVRLRDSIGESAEMVTLLQEPEIPRALDAACKSDRFLFSGGGNHYFRVSSRTIVLSGGWFELCFRRSVRYFIENQSSNNGERPFNILIYTPSVYVQDPRCELVQGLSTRPNSVVSSNMTLFEILASSQDPHTYLKKWAQLLSTSPLEFEGQTRYGRRIDVYLDKTLVDRVETAPENSAHFRIHFFTRLKDLEQALAELTPK
ncbi:MAG: hypothetical protein AB7G93_23070 [Bdellovibrionales bacterium]